MAGLNSGAPLYTFFIPSVKFSETSAALEEGGEGGVELQMPRVAIKAPTPAGTAYTHSWNINEEL